MSSETVWAGMMSRCYNPKNSKYHCYGGRGYTAEQYRQGQRDAVAADRVRRGANDEAVLLLREALPHISPSAVNVAIARSGPMHEAFVNTRIRKYLEQVSAPSHTTNKEK